MIKLVLFSAILFSAGLYVMGIKSGRKGETPELRNLIFLKSSQWKVEPALIRAIIQVESNFNPKAKNPSDPSYGLMQITPGLASDFGLITDPSSPSRSEINQLYKEANNLDVGCWYISKLLSRHPFDNAIQMYNVGETGYKRGVRNKPYLEKVRKYYAKFS